MPKTHGTPGPRIIVPDCCTSQSLADCSMGAQLLFDRLIVQSDDQGRQQGEPSIVKAACFPYVEDATPRRIAAWLAELEKAGMVVLYTVGRAPIVQLTGWWTYQSGMRRAYPSRWPAPDGWTDRVFGLTKAEQDDAAGNLPAERGQGAGRTPHSAPDFPPHARGSGASAYADANAGAGADGARPPTDAFEVMLVVEDLTRQRFGYREGHRIHDTLVADVANHGASAIADRYRAFRATSPGPVDAAQLVFGVHNALHPLTSTKPLTDEQRKDAEIAAYVAAANARAGA